MAARCFDAGERRERFASVGGDAGAVTDSQTVFEQPVGELLELAEEDCVALLQAVLDPELAEEVGLAAAIDAQEDARIVASTFGPDMAVALFLDFLFDCLLQRLLDGDAIEVVEVSLVFRRADKA